MNTIVTNAATEWLFVELAPVLLSSKAGELLNVNYSTVPFTRDELTDSIAPFCSRWDCRVTMLCGCERAQKWLFYKPLVLEETLSKIPQEFLIDKLGYPEQCSVEQFIEGISARWQASREIPHEVGFALGYPLADVLGYMGFTNSPCQGCCGWQVYGDMTESHAISQDFIHAKRKACKMLVMGETLNNL